MIRYRCPHCAAPTAAHERRAGQSSVCKACLKPHPIPADPALWLTESGELLHPPATPVEVLSATAPEIELPPIPVREEPQPIAERPDELSSTVPDLHLSEPIFVGSAREPEPEPVVVTPPAAAREPEPVAPRVPPVVRRPRSTPSAPAEPAPESEAASVATVTPPPQPAPRPGRRSAVPVPRPPAGAPRPARTERTHPERTYAEPVQLQTQADIAAALTAALTSRMKPPPAPRRDLRPSTAAWMLLTGIGVALIVVAVYTEANYILSGIRIPALVVGVAQIVIGYVWIVRLTYLREPKRGLLCAIPAVTPYYLFQYKYARLRPLRFVLTGIVLVGLVLLTSELVILTRPLLRKAEPTPTPAAAEAQSKLAQLRTFRDQRAYDSLVKLLEVLAKTDPLRSVDAADRPALAVELQALCGHQLTDVRIAALTAFTLWDPDPNAARARAACLEAVRSPTQEERIRALRLLPRWKDAESARAVQSLIGRAGAESNQAKASLEEIGGPHAEQAAVALLKRADDQSTRLTAIGILETVGGRLAVDELQEYAMATDDPPVRHRALAAVAAIEFRTRKKGP